jgi:hypothetical protein
MNLSSSRAFPAPLRARSKAGDPRLDDGLKYDKEARPARNPK